MSLKSRLDAVERRVRPDRHPLTVETFVRDGHLWFRWRDADGHVVLMLPDNGRDNLADDENHNKMGVRDDD